MGEGTDRIEAHIEFTREQLDRNIDELEHKVRAAADWRRYPLALLGLALAGGVMTSRMAQRAPWTRLLRR